MQKYKLIYFDIPGGRGEPLRMAMHAAGIDYTDERWTFPEFGEKRSELRFRAVPVLEIDGKVVTQSNAIGRYLGNCLLYTSPSPRDQRGSRMPSSA